MRPPAYTEWTLVNNPNTSPVCDDDYMVCGISANASLYILYVPNEPWLGVGARTFHYADWAERGI